MNFWKKLSQRECTERICQALEENINFSIDKVMGYPVSKLDEKVFYDAPFLKDAPVLMTYVANPNHIGCHTSGVSEGVFKGTQELEREVLDMVAVDIFNAGQNQYDGYLASGGTEANIQALWIYRNFFISQHDAQLSEIAIIASEDTHYSIAKGANLLMIDRINIPVGFKNRKVVPATFGILLQKAIADGKKYFIAVANMGTTMFGSVDDPDIYADTLKQHNLPFFLHVDGAYGGFIYPILTGANKLDFLNPDVSSITVDAHKMLQAPYGTGIFICRKNLMENVLTKEAEYVEGFDITFSGSRSGANVIAVWMILKMYGKDGWFEKVNMLRIRTEWLCSQFDLLSIEYFREANMNIVSVRSKHVPDSIAKKFGLVPQKHSPENQWYKIILMQHVDEEGLSDLIEVLTSEHVIDDFP